MLLFFSVIILVKYFLYLIYNFYSLIIKFIKN